jgi:hypothetical protein
MQSMVRVWLFTTRSDRRCFLSSLRSLVSSPVHRTLTAQFLFTEHTIVLTFVVSIYSLSSTRPFNTLASLHTYYGTHLILEDRPVRPVRRDTPKSPCFNTRFLSTLPFSLVHLSLSLTYYGTHSILENRSITPILEDRPATPVHPSYSHHSPHSRRDCGDPSLSHNHHSHISRC